MRVPKCLLVFAIVAFSAVAIVAKESLTLSDVKLAIIDSNGVRKMGESLTYPSKLSAPLVLDGDETLRLSLQIKDKTTDKGIQPHQAFLVLTNENSVDTVQVLQVRDSGKAKLDLNLRAAPKELLAAPHTYQITLLIGTFSHPDPLKYDIGTLNILPSLDISGKSSTPPKVSEIHAPLPVIEHAFRQPEKMPPALFSTIFAGVVLSPWLILIVGWSSIGITPLSLGPLFRLSSLGFYASLVAIEILFYYYWTKLNIFETLGYLAPLAAFGFVSGQRALTELQKRREMSQGKEKKSE